MKIWGAEIIDEVPSTKTVDYAKSWGKYHLACETTDGACYIHKMRFNDNDARLHALIKKIESHGKIDTSNWYRTKNSI